MPAVLDLTDEDWLALEREACRRSLATFIRRAWAVLEPGQAYVHGWHVDAMADHLEAVTAGQITYDLRRLRVRGLITRIPHTHRYRPTEHGLHTAMFISAVHDRFLPTGLAQLADELTAPPLRAASRTYRNALDNLAGTTGLAA